MPIRAATSADLPQIRYLLGTRRSFLNGGLEDLPGLLEDAVTVVGDDGDGLWGFVAFQVEERPDTLLVSAPTRAYLRGAAIIQGLLSPSRLPELIRTAISTLQAQARSLEIMALTDHGWLIGDLRQSGFDERDQIRFYLRTRQDVPQVGGLAHLREIQSADLDALARLDSESFAPRWHMGRADLVQLCFSSRVQVAEHGGALAGYTAVTVHTASTTPFTAGHAQIVRLAVHPQVQRIGIGRQLLADGIGYAHRQGVTRIQLNTQESNRVSQKLYEAMSFRRNGKNLPVLTLSINGKA